MKRERVRDFLLDLIEDGRPGSAIPPERELCQRLGVSRPTLRAAIDELARAGLLVRQRGRGTFTSQHKVTQELSASAAGLSDQQAGPVGPYAAPSAEGSWRSRVLEFAATPAGARLGAKLRLSPANPVLRVVRLRLVDDEPMAIERLHLPHALVPDLTAPDLESGNFYQLLRLRYEVVVSDAVQTIEPTVCDQTEAELLGVPLHMPALLFERTATDATGRTVEFTRSIYRGDRYRITSRLSFDRDSG